VRGLLAALGPDEIRLRQRMTLAEAMMRAALDRRESRGAHWRSDFPGRDRAADGWSALFGRDAPRHSVIPLRAGGSP
jgi:succinate dehydrogenase/fumarate reductase flavoprotein subunit